MKYMVMECHLSYAVVLSRDGRFLKVANRHYEVGQTVTNVIEMQIPQSVPKEKTVVKERERRRWVYAAVAVAAVFLLVFSFALQTGLSTFASIYLSINPEVRIDVNRYDKVIALEGINTEGKKLVEEYKYNNKELNPVIDELVDRAIEMGYLHEGGRITLVLDSGSDEWIATHGVTLGSTLTEHVKEKLSVTIEISDKNNPEDKIVIPMDDDEESIHNDTEDDYDDIDEDIDDTDDNDEETDDDDGEYDSDNDEETDDDDNDYESDDDEETDDDDSDYESDDDEETDDDDSDYESDDDETDDDDDEYHSDDDEETDDDDDEYHSDDDEETDDDDDEYDSDDDEDTDDDAYSDDSDDS
jgi:hypothetical protein